MRRCMFFTRQVNQFIVAVQEGSFLKASEKISITPSAMSKGVGELECKLGWRLIKRTHHGIKTTERGEWLYNQLLPHYDQVNKIKNKIDVLNNEKCITIQTDGLYLPKLKEDMSTLFKDDVDLRILPCQDAGDYTHDPLESNESDIYITTTDYNKKNINRISMKPELVGLMINNSLLNRRFTTKEILEKYPIIQTTSTNSHPAFIKLKDYLKCKGVKFNVFAVGDVTEVCYLVNAGVGVSFMASEMCREKNLLSEVTFLEHPFPSPLILQRYLYFKSDAFSRLIDACSILSGM